MSKHGDPPAWPLYERIEEIRVRRGLSKVQVARAAGVSRQTVANLATQPRPPQPSTVAEIADALGIDREEALHLAGLTAGSGRADMSTTEMQDELIARIQRIRADPERREMLEQYIRLIDPESSQR